MNYLFIHNNWPAQYLHVIIHLAADPANRVIAISQENQNWIKNVEVRLYQPYREPSDRVHHYVRDLEQGVIWGQCVFDLCRGLASEGFRPDVIIGHCGWGETLFVKDVWPDVPLIVNFEYYYRPSGSDVGFDPDMMPVTIDDPPRLRIKNAINALSFEHADYAHTATRWQASLYPDHYKSKVSIIHEGVDTDRARPGDARLRLPDAGRDLTREDQVITYVARNLEPYRGIHIFLRALPQVLREHPNAHVLLVGKFGVSYGPQIAGGRSFKDFFLDEVRDQLDLSRVHFLGHVPYETYLAVLRLSRAHVYLTFPFVLSWSLLEAMAIECPIVASDTAPVREVMRHGDTGLMVDFHDVAGVSRAISLLLHDADLAAGLGTRARAFIRANYDLKTRCLPAMLALIERAIQHGPVKG